MFIMHWALGDHHQPFRYLASDAFYYFAVAANWVDRGVIGFDGEMPSNGFHPLWQIATAAIYGLAKLLGLDARWALIESSAAVGCAMITAALFLVARAAAPIMGRAAVLLLLLPVGIYGVIAWPWVGPRAVLWSQINGLETPLSLLLFGAWLATQNLGTSSCFPPTADLRPPTASLLLGLVVLSRLDTIFLLPALALGPVLEWRAGRRDAMYEYIRSMAVVAAMVAGYMAINMLYCGAPMPVSGAAKSTFPVPSIDNLQLAASLLAEGSGVHLHRAVAVVVPLVFALAGGALVARRRGPVLLVALNLFVVFRHLHDLLFVHLWHIGEWYYPISQIVNTLTAIWLVAPLFDRLRGPRGLAFALVAAEAVFFFWIFRPYWRRNETNLDVYRAREEVRAAYGPSGAKFLCIDDGAIAYGIGYPSMAAIGLNLDVESARAQKAGRLLEHALARGFNRIASTGYVDVGDFVGADAEQLEEGSRKFLRRWNLDPGTRRVAVEFIDEKKSLVVWRID